ncbi:hypothetical protein SAMN05421682_101342 [Chryseobacterium indoltheticum]|uniref:Transglycosylase SLT domain-containing protein n=1 Tax=Chryseobacterium indoltheticum TaxID=254 RepID=A0ABY1JGM4_9FLAO|nr:hypothetical protein [Chryseobacterium indoltheticum]SIP92165.1 hypothetical protein SAMN05421682_101342 [Chryseobacterium indoltheticum]
MKIIKGNANPKAEEKNFYQLSDFIYNLENPLFGKKENEKYIWTLFKKVKNNWKQVSGNIKYGEKVPYTFGEKVVGIPFKIEVHIERKNLFNKNEKVLAATLIVTPRTKNESTIGRVILLNREKANVNTAKFNESLTAEARTSNLVGKEITFYLWEEGAPEDKKYQKPKTAQVDKYGIARVKFILSDYATPQTWMSFFTGDDNVTKKFFVTASYQLKKVTNKTPVTVTDEQQQQQQQQPETKKKQSGPIEKLTEIVLIGVEKTAELFDDKTKTPTSIGKAAKQESPSNCICKEQYKDLVWGGKVSCEFRKKVVQICAELWGESRKLEMANGLMAVMKVETWGSFKAHHREGFKSANDNSKDLTISSFHKDSGSKSSRAVGLIQFTQDALEGMNEFPKSTPATKGTQPRYDALNRLKLSYAQMGEIRQLDKVKKYFETAKSKIKTPEDIYLHVFAPEGVGKNDNYLLYTKGTDKYDNNKSVDKNNDGIQRKEILKRYYDSKNEGENYKTSEFSCGIISNNKDIKATDIVTYHIYYTGVIEKHIPRKIKSGYEQKYKYIFHDKENREHEICVTDWHITTRKLPNRRKVYSKPTHSKIISDKNVTEGQTRRRVIYENGDIAEYGSNNGDTFWRLYESTSEQNELVKMPDSVSYVNYSFSGTQRRYTGPSYFAGFLGALAITGLSISTTGSCFREGSCFPSQFHVNGESIDTIYFWNLGNDQKFIDSMKFFHFRERKAGNNPYFKKLKNVNDGGDLHDNHLHCGSFDESKIKVIKE